jgi:hypothetical protein
MSLPAGLRARLEELFPGASVVRVSVLGDDDDKAIGYGRPLKIELGDRTPEAGTDATTSRVPTRVVVFHTARPDDFGHDRRADRVANMMLAYDTFDAIPYHARAVDAGLVTDDGALVSVAGTGEPYMISEWVDGTIYADELRHGGDASHAATLARVLLEIHAKPGSHPAAYTRAIRDLLGHGEGIFGLVDSYDTSVIPPARLRALEEACLAWRWKLRGQAHRLRRTHGDFHPFNILFDAKGKPHLLDTSRGSEGDPADDVACLAINYVFFRRQQLWDTFWSTYLSGDRVDVCAAVAPFFAWRALVLASPKWYPHLAAADRERILAFAERALAADRFDPHAGWPS